MVDEIEKAKRLLSGAYALKSAQDNIEYYREFAPVYEDQYVTEMGYSYPAALAQVYASYCRPADLPVADIGCGTGLVAQELGLPGDQIDGVDISAEMLRVAEHKSLYRSLYKIDLKSGVADLPLDYGAVVSAGTFTFGHLGPETLPVLVDIGRRGALYCIGVNSIHLEQQGYEDMLKHLTAKQISEPQFITRKIYSGNDSEHARDTATIVVFRKL